MTACYIHILPPSASFKTETSVLGERGERLEDRHQAGKLERVNLLTHDRRRLAYGDFVQLV